MIKGIQVLGILVSVYLMAQTVVQYRMGNYGAKRATLWLSLWWLIALLFAFPSLTILALPILAMEDAMLTVLVVGILMSYMLMYQVYQQAAKTERKLTELVQNMAIHNYVKETRGNLEEKADEE